MIQSKSGWFKLLFLSKAIADGNDNPYLYAYRFSITWEYNKVFYHYLPILKMSNFPIVRMIHSANQC